MPRRLAKPTVVPENHRPLIDALWRFYMVANEPSMRKIAQVITELDDDERDGTANHETVRNILNATKLPQWQTVHVVFLALCRIADVDPDDFDDYEEYEYGEPPRTHRQQLHRFYRLARHGVVTVLPRTREEKAQQRAEQAKRNRQSLETWYAMGDDAAF